MPILSKSGLGPISAVAIAVSLTVVSPSRADVGAEMEAEEQSDDVGAQMRADEAAGEAGPARDKKARRRAPASERRESAARVRRSNARFAAPTGTTGAGLSLSPAQRARFWGELGFHTQEALTLAVPVLGGGYKVTDDVEIELLLPFVYGSRDAIDPNTGRYEDRTTFVIGDPFVGANYLHDGGVLRYKVGGGIAFPFAPDDDAGHFVALRGASSIRAFQDDFLWQPRTLGLVAPARFEYGERVLFGADASFMILLPTGGEDRDAELALTLAPGVGFWVSPETLIGARFGLFWLMTEEGDNAQLSFEPNFRQYFGEAFFQARFTLNIEQPAGFSFDPGGFWGLHLGGGLSF